MTSPQPLTYNGAVTAFRQRLLEADAIALDALTSAYQPIRKDLLRQIALLEKDLSEVSSQSELYKLGRYRELLAQVDAEVARLAAQAETVIREGQEAFVQWGAEEARTLSILQARGSSLGLANQVTGSWNMLNTEAFTDLVGRLSDGSPLSEYLEQLPNQFGESIKGELLRGIALGKHPRAIAQLLEQRLDGQMSRLIVGTRSAMLDSYRSASIRSMQESDVVSTWMWTSAHDNRVCLACLALDGQTFPVSESFMKSHLGCRCAPRPMVDGASPPDRETGSTWFDKQPDDVKRAMLPNYAYDAYRTGKITLKDFVAIDKDERWGDRYRVGSVKTKVGKAA